jgi:hypothetical protein
MKKRIVAFTAIFLWVSGIALPTFADEGNPKLVQTPAQIKAQTKKNKLQAEKDAKHEKVLAERLRKKDHLAENKAKSEAKRKLGRKPRKTDSIFNPPAKEE